MEVNLTTEQAQFLSSRALNQTAHLASPIHPEDLAALAITFYLERPDFVENVLQWKGAKPCTWPLRPHELHHYDAQSDPHGEN